MRRKTVYIIKMRKKLRHTLYIFSERSVGIEEMFNIIYVYELKSTSNSAAPFTLSYRREKVKCTSRNVVSLIVVPQKINYFLRIVAYFRNRKKCRTEYKYN